MVKFITPTALQKQCIDKICTYYHDRKSTQPYFLLTGYAGTGKSSIIPPVVFNLGLDIDNPKDVMFLTFTNKAASVLRKKGIKNATTVHSAIYRVNDEGPNGMTWSLNHESPVRYTKLLVLDEISMLNEDIGRDLLYFKKKIVASGDLGQLPPVSGEGFFFQRKPDFFLHEVHRTALDSPIIAAATLVREGGILPFGDYGDVLKVRYDPDEHLPVMLEMDQILTGKNTTRRLVNRRMADSLGFVDQYPSNPGIKLVGIKNKKDLGLFNGCQYVTSSGIRKLDEKIFRFEIDVKDAVDDTPFREVQCYTSPFIDGYSGPEKREVPKREQMISRDYMGFDYGYVLSVHRSQGSEWDSVGLLDHDAFGSWDPEFRKKWLYTGITRASSQLIWFG